MAWYLVAAGLFVSAIGVAAIGVTQWFSAVEGMQRFEMPGKVQIMLPMGTTTLYGESQSIVDGKAFASASELSFKCQVTGPAGVTATIDKPSSKVTYSAAGFSGQNAFDIHTDTAGPHTLECESPSPFVAAIGTGIGTWLVVALVGGLVPAGIGVLVFVLVLLKRSSQKRRLATPIAPAG